MNNIYSPKNIEDAKSLCELLANDKYNPQQLLTLHANFGHHFDGNVAITAQQAYLLKGKPSLSADAMHAIARKSGLVRFIRVASLDHQHCTYEMSRRDEPQDVVHIWTYTFQMAEHQGLTRNRNWQQMPMQMLRARALTLGLRGTFPEAVSGIYSADEIADNQSMNDDERAELSAEVLGEKLEKVEKKTKINMSTGEIVEPSNPAPAAAQTRGYNFSSVDNFYSACKDKGLKKDEVEHALLIQQVKLDALTAEERCKVFYLVCCTPAFRKSQHKLPPPALESQIMLVDTLRKYTDIKLKTNHSDDLGELTKRLGSAAWHETLMLVKGKSGDYKSGLSFPIIDAIKDVLTRMNPDDWSAYDHVKTLISDPSSFDDASNVAGESVPF